MGGDGWEETSGMTGLKGKDGRTRVESQGHISGHQSL